MSEIFQAEFECPRTAWEDLLAHFEREKFNVEKRMDLGDKGCVLYVRFSKADRPQGGVLLSFGPRDEQGEVEIHWMKKTGGDKPRASWQMAANIQKVLLQSGAVCRRDPVPEMSEDKV